MNKSFPARALWLAGLLALAPVSFGQTLETFAGGKIVDNLPALQTPLVPTGLTAGPDGAIYVSSTRQGNILRLDPSTGMLTVRAPGGANATFNNSYVAFHGPSGHAYLVKADVLYEIDPITGQATALTQLNQSGNPRCVAHYSSNSTFAVDAARNVYFVDGANNAVCRVIGWNNIQRIAGADAAPGYGGDGGPALNARFSFPSSIVIDAANNLIISDTGNHRVRKITTATGIITTIAGNGTAGYSGENAVANLTRVDGPTELLLDSAGNLFISESGGLRVRRLDPQTGRLTTFAGTGFYSITDPDGGLAIDTSLGYMNTMALHPSGDLLIADTSRHVRRISRTTGRLNNIIGNGTAYFCGETSQARDACLDEPQYVAVHPVTGDVYISDTVNARVRKVSPTTGALTTVAGRGNLNSPYQGEGGLALDMQFGTSLEAIAFDLAGNLYISSGGRLLRMDAATSIITRIAGGATSGYAGDGGPATAARINSSRGLAVDATGNVYLSDSWSHRVRRVDAVTGVITTVVGNGLTSGPLGDGGPATAASLYMPSWIGFDPAGNLVVADLNHSRIRKVDRNTGVISTIAGNGTFNNSGDGGPATAAGMNNGNPFVFDAVGNLFTISGAIVRRVDAATGIITSVAPPVPNRSPEGFWLFADSLAMDAQGRLYVGTTDAVLRISGLPFVMGQVDSTSPEIAVNVSGTAGLNGWYRGNVQISWTVTDAESTVSSSTGCATSSVTEDTTGVTFTCSATSAGGTATQSVTVKRDTAAPTLNFGSAAPAPNAGGWNSGDVSVPFEATDTLSGIYTTSSGSPVIVTGEGAGLSAQVIVTDFAGNAATFTTPAFNIDRSPPSLSPNVSGTLGANGWYTSDVQVSWTLSDDGSPIHSTEGCEVATVTTDTDGVTFSCVATSAAGTATGSITVKRDATPPQIVFGTPSPAPNAGGWNSTDVSIPYTMTDALSGIVGTSIPSPVIITGEGIGLRAPVTVTDGAGNSTTAQSPPVNIDRSITVVTVTPVVTGTLGNEGWYRSNIGVSWAVTGNVSSSTGCGASSITTDTAGITFTCSATSATGTVTNSVTVKRDATPPILTWRAGTPAANAAGWNRANVSFPYNTPTDARSGVASVSAASPVVVSTEGTGVTASVTVTDRAGNSAVFTTTPRNIDKTAPTVTITTPASNAVVGLYATAFANYSCVDAASGVTSCSGTQANGAPLNTRVMNGWYTFRVTGADAAGNSFQRSHNWSTAGSFLFEGYLAPMQNDPVFNLVTAGSRVPMRFKLPDRLGSYVSDPAIMDNFAVASERCLSNVVPLNDTATGGPGLSFDSATSTYTYNWDTDASWAGTCRNVKLRLIDGSRHTLMFKFQ